eukprot:5227402-Pyramimonas_sp.AAC.1
MLPDCILAEHIVQRLAAQVNIALRRWTAARPTRALNCVLASKNARAVFHASASSSWKAVSLEARGRAWTGWGSNPKRSPRPNGRSGLFQCCAGFKYRRQVRPRQDNRVSRPALESDLLPGA